MAELPIRLKYCESDTFSPGGGVTGVQNTVLSARVRNIAFEKDVAVRYKDLSGAWTERPLAWQQNFGAHDLFAAADHSFATTEFALRYAVADQEFWDNDGGANYRVDEIRPNTVGGQVALQKATARRGSQAGGGFVFTTSWVEGAILVKNLSFGKRVGIRLSTNGWATFEDTLASFAGAVSVAEGISVVETWSFKTPELNLDQSGSEFVFAVFYNDLDTGQWFWDNALGEDYRLSKVDGASVE
jgi:hypothetical protein